MGSNWPLKKIQAFNAPVGGFDASKTKTMIPKVDQSGDGYIVDYTDSSMYFPAPYSVMVASLLQRQYALAFASFSECFRGWEIITSTSPSRCMDPKPQDVPIYRSPDHCGQRPPNVCWESTTVKDLYDVDFACSAAHDVQYANISFYQAKCHPI